MMMMMTNCPIIADMFLFSIELLSFLRFDRIQRLDQKFPSSPYNQDAAAPMLSTGRVGGLQGALLRTIFNLWFSMSERTWINKKIL